MPQDEHIAKPSRWASPDEFAALMERIAYAHETGYIADEANDPLDIACQSLLYAWQCGTVRIERPLD